MSTAGLHRFSTADYEHLASAGAFAGQRVELLDGLVVDVSPPGEEHVEIVQGLVRLFAARLDLLRVQAPLAVADGWLPEPDVALVTKTGGRLERPTTAHLVVEVAVSSRPRDLRKADVYARAGIERYWIVDLEAACVLEHSGPGVGGYRSICRLAGDDELVTGVEGLEPFTVAAILAPAQ